MVARLHRLEDLNFQFGDRKVSGHILSHVLFPESIEVEVGAGHHADLPEALSQLSYNLTPLYRFTTDNFRFSLPPWIMSTRHSGTRTLYPGSYPRS